MFFQYPPSPPGRGAPRAPHDRRDRRRRRPVRPKCQGLGGTISTQLKTLKGHSSSSYLFG